jgi:hypothetical protein
MRSKRSAHTDAREGAVLCEVRWARPECAVAWRAPLLGHLRKLELTLVIGQYALAYHLPRKTDLLPVPRQRVSEVLAT